METIQLYKIVCFKKNGNNKTIRKGLTLNDARLWCNRPDTKGNNWFHGFTKQ
jgi:hypothetical protein